MVRKSKGAAQETHAALLDAAEREFSSKGVTRTTLNDVALAAGMTRGAIYWHFKDKSALVQAMCDRVFLPMQTLLNEIAATPGKDPLVALKQMMQHMLGQIAGNPRQRAVFDIMFHHCEKNDEMVFLQHEKQKRGECLAKLEAIVREAVLQKKLPADTDTFLAMHAINGYLIGLIYEWLIDPQAYDLGAQASAMIEVFLAGLIAHPPRKLAACAKVADKPERYEAALRTAPQAGASGGSDMTENRAPAVLPIADALQCGKAAVVKLPGQS